MAKKKKKDEAAEGEAFDYRGILLVRHWLDRSCMTTHVLEHAGREQGIRIYRLPNALSPIGVILLVSQRQWGQIIPITRRLDALIMAGLGRPARTPQGVRGRPGSG